MSIQAVAAVLELGPEINGARRLILIALANHADAEGFCYPSRKTIAREAGITRLNTVTDHLTWLTRNGYLARNVNAWSGTGGQIPAHKRPNLYQLTLPINPPPGPTEATREPGRGAPRETGTPGSPGNGYQNHHGEPSSESSLGPPAPTPPSYSRDAVPDDPKSIRLIPEDWDDLSTQIKAWGEG